MATTTGTVPATSNQGRNGNSRRGRGRGGRQGGGQRRKNEPKATPIPAASATEPAEDTNIPEADAQSSVDPESVCWICAEPVRFYSVSECNHRTCHVCALRLRALYKRMDCTFCKHAQSTLIFTLLPDKDFESFTPEDIPFKDNKLSISFETQEMMEESLILLRFNCPDSSCDFIAHGWGDLKMHVRATHGKAICDMCIRHKKVFAHEHILYQPSQLPFHLPSISHRPPGKNQAQKQVEGGVHPLCEFCRECYFGDDELFAHMRERHEECFLCKRSDIRDQYFQDYNSLEKHFDVSHFPCNDTQCQAQKFVVFGSALDLKAHMVEQHGKEMSAKDRKDARRVEATFEYDDPATRQGRGRGREREREPPEPGPTHPSRREGFGASLSTSSPALSHPPTPQPQSLPLRNDKEPPLDPATAERHAAFLNRLNIITGNSTNAVPAVRAAIRSYRSSESGPRDLISTIFNVVNRDLDSTASLVSALVELLDDEEKRTALLASWNGFKLEQQRQFPELRPSGVGTEYAGVAGGRILNAKHSASVRSSSNQSQRQVWDRVAQAAASSSTRAAVQTRPQERFPSLAASKNVPAFRQPQSSTAWSSAGASSSSSSPNTVPAIRSVTVSSGDSRKSGPPQISTSQFPSLPSSSANKPRPQVSGNQSLKNILGDTGAKPAPAWGQKGEEEGAADSTDTQPEAAPKGKKKKGKEKQTLFTFGTFPT